MSSPNRRRSPNSNNSTQRRRPRRRTPTRDASFTPLPNGWSPPESIRRRRREALNLHLSNKITWQDIENYGKFELRNGIRIYIFTPFAKYYNDLATQNEEKTLSSLKYSEAIVIVYDHYEKTYQIIDSVFNYVSGNATAIERTFSSQKALLNHLNKHVKQIMEENLNALD